MEEMRVQIEAREPTDGEIRAFWFTLPIDTEQVEELLGIDVDTDYYYITGKERIKVKIRLPKLLQISGYTLH